MILHLTWALFEHQNLLFEIDLIEKMKDYAYSERVKISDIVNQVLRDLFKDKEVKGQQGKHGKQGVAV